MISILFETHLLLLELSSLLSGIFFVMPCIETYQKVDLRTITLGVPPQEVTQYTSFSVCAMRAFKPSLDRVSIKQDVLVA